jgi:hypothetical protein
VDYPFEIPELDSDAIMSGEDEPLYRYMLWRRWGPNPENMITWVMLNPSTADATEDDPTIRRIVGFSRREGFDAARVVNLFALRATDPNELTAAADPVGPDNDAQIIASVAMSGGRAIVAWGAHRFAVARAIEVADNQLRGADLRCLGLTNKGYPRHPLYMPGEAPLIVFRAPHPIIQQQLDDRA